MATLHPILFPQSLDVAGLGLTGGHTWKHLAVRTAPDGGRYTLSDVGPDLTHAGVSHNDRGAVTEQVLTRYSPDGRPSAQTLVRGSHEWSVADALSVLPDGRPLLSTRDNRARVLEPGLDTAEPVCAPGTDRWAHRTRTTPSGRVLCLLGDNVVAVSQEPVGTELPELTAVTALRRERPALRGPRYYPPSDGSGEGEPRTELAEQITGRYGTGFRVPRPESVRDVVPIDDSTFVVLMLGWFKHAAQRGGDFLFGLVDSEGTLLGHLDLDTHRDSPCRGVRYDVVTDHRRDRIVHLNTFGLYTFDLSGNRTCQLSTEDRRFAPLKHFRLHDIDGNGGLVLVHEKQHLVLTVPLPDDVSDLPDAVTDALAHFRRARHRLKKEYAPTDWNWTTSEVPLNA
ncbi:hypothetical protein IDM40_23390 [Nocardiopsis sp. HNM0947]|uniref:Uncharacterized protein n=1 Tax=Nocardiopsis coralli TaxID=2772213 RepID=A0ABR9PCS5_9ACTN|nr:hypothetical protein [Nocardiopsis coralli]MBE3001614.1 hypothetical protein [Nocardiopsis coralli]